MSDVILYQYVYTKPHAVKNIWYAVTSDVARPLNYKTTYFFKTKTTYFFKINQDRFF